VDALYGVPLERFVEERDELARQLRREARRDDAARVARQPKPALAAWAANQALRSQEQAARELLAAGAALTQAQRAVVRGRADTGELREAIERHRRALDRVVEGARQLVDGKGRMLGAATLERVRHTLAAASLDPELADEAKSASLQREHLYTGVGELAPTSEVRPSRPASASPSPRQRASASRAVAAHEQREREKRTRRAAQIKAARTRLGETRKRTATARKARDAAARAADRAAADSRRAEQRHAKALEEEALAQSRLDALLR
jgi:hypothetical protein